MSRNRLQIVIAVMAVVFIALLGRLFTLHIVQHEHWKTLAGKQHELSFTLPPERGNITDRNGKAFATSRLVPSVYAVPYEIVDPAATAGQLSAILNEAESRLRPLLTRKKSFVWLKRQVSDTEGMAVQSAHLEGIAIRYENKRFYPQGQLLSPVIGFCSIDEQGLEGIELKYNRYLTGWPGYRKTKRDALGREIAAYDELLVRPVNGHHIALTVDQFIQFHTEEALADAIEKWGAKGGMAMVMDPRSGEILSVASLPSFDPNLYQDADVSRRRNRAITDYFEPGSTFKFITASAALEDKVFDFASTIYCENGSYKVSRHTLHDVKPYGHLSFPQVFIKSSNIGTVKIAQKLGEKRIYDQVKRFGFGEITGIELPGEAGGVLRAPQDWSKLSIGAVPIGHEVGVTSLQMVRAISAIANGGKLMRPYIVKEVRDRRGEVIEEGMPLVTRTVVEEEVAAQLTEILTGVVEEGTGRNAQISGIAVAGKTGTAQKLTADGKTYSHDKFTSAFVGFAPADKPRFAMIVVLDEPKGKYYGGTVAAPVFKTVMQEILLQEGLWKAA